LHGSGGLQDNRGHGQIAGHAGGWCSGRVWAARAAEVMAVVVVELWVAVTPNESTTLP